MMTLNGYYSLLIRLIKTRVYPFSLVIPILLLILPVSAVGQSSIPAPRYQEAEINRHPSLSSLILGQGYSAVAAGDEAATGLQGLQDAAAGWAALQDTSAIEGEAASQDTAAGEGGAPLQTEFPDPESVLYKSLIIPGWGQIVNRQAWKIPLIYGLFGGLGYVTHTLTLRYHDYRAAYYNRTQGADSDFRFGATPDWIPVNVNLEELRDARDNTRNQRDSMFIVLGLAYGLNALDAYVYAHMRSFDVSDDLSARATIAPLPVDGLTPGIRVRVQLINKR